MYLLEEMLSTMLKKLLVKMVRREKSEGTPARTAVLGTTGMVGACAANLLVFTIE